MPTEAELRKMYYWKNLEMDSDKTVIGNVSNEEHSITVQPSMYKLDATVKNLGKTPIQVLIGQTAITDPNNKSRRVWSGDGKLIDRDKSSPELLITPKASIDISLYVTDDIVFEPEDYMELEMKKLNYWPISSAWFIYAIWHPKNLEDSFEKNGSVTFAIKASGQDEIVYDTVELSVVWKLKPDPEVAP